MAVQAVNGTNASQAPMSAAVQNTPSLGKDAFLNLLLTQMKMQDPLEPLKNEEMIAQLAQFSSLEQLQNMSGALQQNLDVNLALGQMLSNTMATTLLGKEVHVNSDTFKYEPGNTPPVGYDLKGDAQSVSVKIYDENGKLVRTMTQQDQGMGAHSIEWDGKDDSGIKMSGGTYTIKVEAKHGDDTVESRALLIGRVSGIRYKDGGAQVLLGGTEVALGAIEDIHP